MVVIYWFNIIPKELNMNNPEYNSKKLKSKEGINSERVELKGGLLTYSSI